MQCPDFREKARLRANAWYNANKERAFLNAKSWLSNNREKRKEIAQKWKDENREKVRSAGRDEYRKYKDRFYAHRHIRIARLKIAQGEFTAIELQELRAKQNSICALCGLQMDKESIDHIVPLSKGGTNFISNIQLAHLTCNKRKGSKHLQAQEMISSLGKPKAA